jgi:ribonucleotide reductase beta subunit family protein with ferritin-like domain
MPPQIEQDEPILICDDNRFTTFPIIHNDIFSLYQKQVDLFWRPEEIDLSKDYVDFMTLNADEQYFIKMIIAFFSSSDGIVQENIASRFLTDVGLSESRSFLSFQIAMENIHSHTYSLLIDSLIREKEEKDKLFNAIENYGCIKQKADFCKKYLTCDCPFAIRLLAFCCIEGIFFSGAFCSIYWLKSHHKGKLNGLTFSNELISRDEGLHVEHLVLLYKKLKNKLSLSQIEIIIKRAVEIETEFITDALPVRLIGMNSDSMIQYIQYCADRLVIQLGYKKIYDVKNPFPFMEMISIESKTNFFEKKVSDYSLATKTVNDNTFELSEDGF